MEKSEPKPRRRIFGHAMLYVATATVISSAYIIYMFRWTTLHENLEASHMVLVQEHRDLETAFRKHVDDYQDFIKVTGFDEEAETTVGVEGFETEVKSELEKINETLSPPLKPEEVTLKRLILELMNRNSESDEEISRLRAEMREILKRHELERKENDLQALIYVKKIDRLEKRIRELGGD
jgi:hypothetical protein